MLNNIGNNVLMAGINSTASSATATQTAVSAFVSAPSAATLTAAQTAFATLAQTWAATAPFDFGPIQDNLIEATVDTWPASDSKIEAAITAGSTAASVGADTKGLKGLAYLLFDANGNTAVLAKYTGSGATSRGTFANSVAADLVMQTTSLQNYWKNGYLASFESAKGNDVSSSVGQLINAISLYLDQVKNMKIGSPIGMGVKVNDNLPHPTLIEYTIAEQSLPVMAANLQAMKAAFDGGTGQGLDDLLNYVNAKSNGQNLSTVVDAQFNDAISKIAAITPPYGYGGEHANGAITGGVCILKNADCLFQG